MRIKYIEGLDGPEDEISKATLINQVISNTLNEFRNALRK